MFVMYSIWISTCGCIYIFSHFFLLLTYAWLLIRGGGGGKLTAKKPFPGNSCQYEEFAIIRVALISGFDSAAF